MPRINPDQFDQIVWTMTETSGNYHNTGSFLPNNATTDLVVTNTLVRTGSGIVLPNCLQIPGSSNFPSGSSSTRNYASGANTVTLNPPFTVSGWVQLRSYTTNNNSTLIGKEYRNPSISG